MVETSTKTRRGRPQQHSLLDADSDRTQLIKQAIEEHWTLQRIGDCLGLTRERARQLVALYRRVYGSTPDLSIVAALADEWGVFRDRIRRVMYMYNIPIIKRRFVHNDNIPKLREALEDYSFAVCNICGQKFRWADDLLALNRHKPKICSDQCKRMRVVKCWYTPMRPSRATKWGRLAILLEQHLSTFVGDVHWMSLREACLMSGLSPMQIKFLRTRSVLSSRVAPINYSPTRVRAKVMEYRLDEIQVVRDYVSSLPNA